MDRVFLSSKLRRPDAPRHKVERARLAQRLNQGLEHRLILVSAPAGYGKTTAVSDWVGRCRLPAAWLSLDEEDAEITTIMTYVTAAVESVYPDACRSTGALLRLAKTPPATVIADQLVSDLCGISGELVLVLDDCHLVHDMDFYVILGKVLRHPPSGLHLVLITRHDPPLSLGTLRAQDGITEIRIADLQFTIDETGRLLRQATGWRPNAATLAAVEEQLEGWPVGLHLLIRALEGATGHADEVVQAMRSSVRPAADYLATELLAGVPAEVRRRLIETALLERFCAPLVDALCAETAPGDEGTNSPAAPRAFDGTQFIDYLNARDLFVIPLDDEAVWYRYHGALRAILRQYLAREYGQAACDALHQRAATWYERHDQVDQALHHAVMLEDWDRAAAIVRTARVAAVNREDWRSIRRWLELLPRDLVEGSPELLVARALELQNTQQLGKVDDLVTQAEALAQVQVARLTPAERRVLDAEIATLRANSSYWRSDVAAGLAAAQRAFDLAPDHLHFVRGVVALYLGLGKQMTGYIAEAQALLRQAVEDGADEPAPYQGRVFLGLALATWASADLDSTVAAARRLAALGRQHGLLASLGWAEFLAGAVAYLRDDVDGAVLNFSSVVERPYASQLVVELQAHFGLAAAHLAAGRRAEATQWADRATAWALERGMPGALDLAEAFRARLGLMAGQAAPAIAWAESRLPPAYAVPLPMIEDPVLTWIQAQLARPGGAGLEAAASALADHRRFCAGIHATLRLIHVLALEALVLDATDRREAALDALGQAFRLAEPGDIIRPFLDARPSLVPLLRALAADPDANGHVHHVLATASGAEASVSPGSARRHLDDGMPVDTLTPRELEVLALLDQRYSNKEIAARLVVSPVTVKTHAHSIYSKLGARNRREAVARARDMGLLPDG